MSSDLCQACDGGGVIYNDDYLGEVLDWDCPECDGTGRVRGAGR